MMPNERNLSATELHEASKYTQQAGPTCGAMSAVLICKFFKLIPLRQTMASDGTTLEAEAMRQTRFMPLHSLGSTATGCLRYIQGKAETSGVSIYARRIQTRAINIFQTRRFWNPFLEAGLKLVVQDIALAPSQAEGTAVLRFVKRRFPFGHVVVELYPDCGKYPFIFDPNPGDASLINRYCSFEEWLARIRLQPVSDKATDQGCHVELALNPF